MKHRYLSYSDFLKKKYGYQIYRVGVDAGFSCPNRRGISKDGGCVFCDSHGATAAYLRVGESSYNSKSDFVENIDSIVGDSNLKNIEEQIIRGREFLVRRYKAEHFALYFQAFSNTFAPVCRLKTVYDSALKHGTWEQLIVSTRPDCIDDEKLCLIKSYQNQGIIPVIELGLQSGDDEILAKMNRGHDVDCFVRAANLVKKYKIELCVHVLLGFPSEGKPQLNKTISVINSVHPDAIKIHNLNIVANTKLYEDFKMGLIQAPNAEQHIQSVIYVLKRIYPDIVIERFICETPKHRLASPREFPDKNKFLQMLDKEMEAQNATQGDCLSDYLTILAK